MPRVKERLFQSNPPLDFRIFSKETFIEENNPVVTEKLEVEDREESFISFLGLPDNQDLMEESN